MGDTLLYNYFKSRKQDKNVHITPQSTPTNTPKEIQSIPFVQVGIQHQEVLPPPPFVVCL